MSVYFVAVGGMVKIGFSDNPLRRAAHLFAGSTLYSAPAAAYDARGQQVLLGYVDGTKDDEAAVHRALSDFSAGLEWFVDEQPVRDYLLHLIASPGNYVKVERFGGPVQVSRYEQAGHNVRAQESIVRKRHGDAVADQMVAAVEAERAGGYDIGPDLTDLFIRHEVKKLMDQDIADGYLDYDPSDDTIRPTAKWHEREQSGGVA